MARYIDADAFEVIGLPDASEEFALGVQYAMELLDKAPTIDARPVVRGRWEDRYTPNGKYVSWDGFYCSVCGKQATKSNFCPNCGADMRGTKDDARS